MESVDFMNFFDFFFKLGIPLWSQKLGIPLFGKTKWYDNGMSISYNDMCISAMQWYVYSGTTINSLHSTVIDIYWLNRSLVEVWIKSLRVRV